MKKIARLVIGERNITIMRTKIFRMARKTGLLHEKPQKDIHPFHAEIKEFSCPNRQTFFGYYDKTPFSSDNTRLLANTAHVKNVPPKFTDTLQLGFFHIDTGLFHPFGETTTWCWQQGCRLQWYPVDEKHLVIYNKMVGSSYGSVIQDVLNGEIHKTFETPIYDISKDGRYALTLNFSRLHRLRPGYGYIALKDHTGNEHRPENDGVWLLDLNTGKKELIVSIKDITGINPLDSMKDADHYINHLLFNPSGDRFMFLHLWNKSGKRFSRLITSDLKGSNLAFLANEGHVSHYTWKNDRELLLYATHHDTGQGYHLYHDLSDYRTPIAKGVLTSDGHPTYSPSEPLLLTDTKPDRFGEQHILLYNSMSGKAFDLGRFYNPSSYYGEVRCDLHPRWDRHGRAICFDSAHEGIRALYVMPWLNNLT